MKNTVEATYVKCTNKPKMIQEKDAITTLKVIKRILKEIVIIQI